MPFPPEPGLSNFQHGRPKKTAVLLINLGTPDEPTPSALKRYLKEFLSDHRVVEMSRLPWWLILNCIILQTRPKKSAAKYASIWTKDGSPLKVHTERLTKLLKGSLGETHGPIEVAYAMRYGSPSVADVIDRLRALNCQRILCVPLYPQYAASTSATALDAVYKHLQQARNQPEIRVIRSFPDYPRYIEALVRSIHEHWVKVGLPRENDRLLISFHGVPKSTLHAGDPYYCECQKTARLLREALRLSSEQALVTFQSRFGKAEWLTPYTAPTLTELAQKGIERVDVICPGFVTDCLETLEEIAVEGKEDFLAAGGKTFHYIPCVNDRADWVAAFHELVATHLSGWPTEPPDIKTLADSAANAKSLGAQR